MTTTLHPELLTVRELFTEDVSYTVPIYQRNFAWDEAQIEQLVLDVRDAMDEADEDDCYFLGNLVVVRRDAQTPPTYEVVDGQQRLTTLYLLLSALSRSGAGPFDGHLGRLVYESRPRAAAALRHARPLDDEEPPRSEAVSGDTDPAIASGAAVITQVLRQAFSGDDRRRLAAFADHLRDRVTVVRASLPGSIDLNAYFEVMNTRGEQLSPVDIVKARMMSRLTGEPAAQDCFARIWDACADMDSYVQMALTRGDTALRDSLFGEDWSWLQPESWEEVAAILAPVGTTSARSETARTVDEALGLYAAAPHVEDPGDEDNERFRSVIDFPAFLLQALEVVGGSREPVEDESSAENALDDKRLIQLFGAAYDHAPAEDVKRFAVDLLRLRNLFDASVVKREFTSRSGDDGDWSLRRLVKQVSGGTATAGYRNTLAQGTDGLDDGAVDEATGDLVHLQSMLRITYTSPRTMRWLTLLLRHMQEATSPESALRDAGRLLRDHARDRVRAAYLDATPRPTGFEIPRVVFTYLDYLLLQEMPRAERAAFRFTFRTSIEHFYPRHPDHEQGGDVVGPDHLDLLGNLALVSVGANSKFSNNLPGAKATSYRQTIERQSPKMAVMAGITRETGWGDAQVVQHHIAVTRLLERDVCTSRGGRKDDPPSR